jgi:hypothetical protein
MSTEPSFFYRYSRLAKKRVVAARGMVRIIIWVSLLLLGVFLSLISIFVAVAFLLGLFLFIFYRWIIRTFPEKPAESFEPQQKEYSVQQLAKSTRTQDIPAIIIALIALMAVIYFVHLSPAPHYVPQDYTKLEKYRATLTPKDSSMHEFILKEEVELSGPIKLEPELPNNKDVESSLRERNDTKRWFRLRERTIRSTSEGFLTMKIFYVPLETYRLRGWNRLVLASGEYIQLLLNDFKCEDVSIELRNMPKGSFQSARYSQKEEKQPFAETETIRWSVNNLEDSIGVAFVKPRFEKYVPILSPFLGISSMNGWFAALLALFLTVVIAAVIDFAKDKIKAVLGKATQEQSKKEQPVEDDESGKGSSDNDEMYSPFE